MKSKSVSPARLAAFEILQRVENGAFASVLLARHDEDLSPADRALAHELVLGVLRHQSFLDSLIQHYANRDTSKLDAPVRIALRLGLYQLRFLSRIPASAAVNESVNLVRIARLRSAEPFVNAVLRRATREPDYDPLRGITDPVDRLAIETSHPKWMLERWINSFGLEFTAAFASANNELPPLVFRVVKNRITEREVIEHLRLNGAQLRPSEIAEGAWHYSGPAGSVVELAREGKLYIQDEASQLVPRLLNPKPGERILDLCSAPGSKTTEIADLAGDQATVIACDLNDARLRTVAQTAELHGLKSIRTFVADATKPLPFPDSAFDAVLLDAPCSGTGTLRRNPEIRWRITPADLVDLSSRQRLMLENAATVVRPFGRLIYSTCSVETEENEEVVASFVEANPSFRQSTLSADPPLINDHGTIRTWPQREGTDGFFVAAFVRDN